MELLIQSNKEDRKDLPEYKNGDNATHYSQVEIERLRQMVELVENPNAHTESSRSLSEHANLLKNGGYALI